IRFRLTQFVLLPIVFSAMESFDAAASVAPALERFYIGTYAGAIYHSSLNVGTGILGSLSVSATSDSPSWEAITPNRKFLYAVNEFAALVSAFSVNPTNGVLTLLNQQSSNGSGPAHVVVDSSGRNVLVANYG